MQTKVILSTPDTLTTILMLPAQIYFQPWPSFSRTLISHSQLDALSHLKVNIEGPINHLPALPTFPPTLWAPWLTLLLSLSSRLKTCPSYFLLCFSHLIVTTKLPNSSLSVLLMSSSHSPLKQHWGLLGTSCFLSQPSQLMLPNVSPLYSEFLGWYWRPWTLSLTSHSSSIGSYITTKWENGPINVLHYVPPVFPLLCLFAHAPLQHAVSPQPYQTETSPRGHVMLSHGPWEKSV